MHCDCHSLIYRALVTHSNDATGEIKVKIPSVIGTDSIVSISYIGRSAKDGYWAVPEINEQILVSSDDENLSNVFWLQTDPSFFARIPTYYGAFSDYTDQYAGGATTLETAQANVAAPMRFTNTDEARGVSIVDGSKITFAHSGVYNIQWSGQFENRDNSPHDVDVWLRKGGVGGVVGSNGRVHLPQRKDALDFSHTIVGWNFVFTVNAGEYYEFIWSTENINVSIQTYPISTVPTRPSTASLVLTVTPVVRVQDESIAATGLGINPSSITSSMLVDGTIVDGDISALAGISLSKLASGTSGQVIVGATGTGVPTYRTISGDITIDSTGVTALSSTLPRGVVAYNTRITSTTSVSTEASQLVSTAFTPVIGRKYRITYYEPNVWHSAGSNAQITCRIRQTGTINGVTNKLLQTGTNYVQSLGYGGGVLVSGVHTFDSAVSMTLYGTAASSSGVATASRTSDMYAYIMVEDIGVF